MATAANNFQQAVRMRYFIIEDGKQAGPYSIYELKDKAITSDTLVWAEGMQAWTPAWQVDELKSFLYGQQSATTPPPYTPPVPPEQAAPQPQPLHEQPRKSHWGRYVLIGVVLLLAVCAFTNPSKGDHERKIQQQISKVIDRETSRGSDLFSEGLGVFAKFFAGGIIENALSDLLEYHNYVVFSTETFQLPGSAEQTVSYGFLGHVFTADEEDIIRAASKYRLINSPSAAPTHEADADSDDANDEQVAEDTTQIDDELTGVIAKSVGNIVKKQVAENTDSTTSSGIGKIIDAVVDLIK